MTMLSKWILTAAVILIVVVGAVLARPKKIIAPTNQANGNVATVNGSVNQGNANLNSSTTYPGVVFSTADLPERDPHFEFMATIPSGWVAEYLADGPAINLYNPSAAGQTTLEKSKIYVTYTIRSDSLSSDRTIANHPAQVTATVNIDATEKYIPAWMSKVTQITQVQTNDTAPYTVIQFYQAPDLPDSTFDGFVSSLQL